YDQGRRSWTRRRGHRRLRAPRRSIGKVQPRPEPERASRGWRNPGGGGATLFGSWHPQSKQQATYTDDKPLVTPFPLARRVPGPGTDTGGRQQKGRPGMPGGLSELQPVKRLPAAVMASGATASGLRLHRALVHRRGALNIIVEVGPGGNKVVLHLILTGVIRPHRDAAGINALLGYEVVLGVDSPLCGHLLSGHLVTAVAAAGFRRRSAVAHHNQGRVGRTLQIQRHVIEAALRVIVNAGR